MIKIVGIAVAVLMLSVILRQYNRNFSVLLVIAGTIIISFLIFGEIKDIFGVVSELSDNISGSSSYIKLMIKALGICVISQILADMCRDSGESALATEVEMSAKVLIITIILPLFTAMINIVTGIIK